MYHIFESVLKIILLINQLTNYRISVEKSMCSVYACIFIIIVEHKNYSNI